MKQISNLFIIFVSICCLIGLIGIKTYIKLKDKHDKLMMYALETKVEYQAKRCYIDKICKGEVNLKYLYDKKYLEPLVNPVTKEVINEHTTINYEKDTIKIKWYY